MGAGVAEGGNTIQPDGTAKSPVARTECIILTEIVAGLRIDHGVEQRIKMLGRGIRGSMRQFLF